MVLMTESNVILAEEMTRLMVGLGRWISLTIEDVLEQSLFSTIHCSSYLGWLESQQLQEL
jgi:hypothetical protein